MNKWLWVIVLIAWGVLLASCGPVDTETEQVVRATLGPPTGESLPTDTPSPPATPTASLPTVVPSARPVVVHSAADVQRITPDKAKSLLDGGQAVLYDARSAGAYRSQHAASAISFPEADVIARFDELPVDTALIFYCT